MVAIPKRIVPYNLDPQFERSIAALCAMRPGFYGRIGHAIDPELLTAEPAKLILTACHAMFKEQGRGPSASVTVLQRLRRLVDGGRLAVESIREVAEYIDEAEDGGLPSEDDAVVELTPVLQHRIRDDAVNQAIEAFAKHGDLSKVVALEDKASRLGAVDTSVGTILGDASFADIQALSELERLPVGVVELDSALDGGLQRAGLGVLIAGSGDGKSMMLGHIAASALRSGLHVVYATLELPVAVVLSRIKSNLTGVPINALLQTKEGREEARKELARMSPILGRLIVQEFTPQATTVEDLKEWVTRCEEQAGRKVDLLIVDYADKLVAPKKKGDKDTGEYTLGRVVYEGLRVFAVQKKFFCWTASQSSRQKDKKKKKLDLNDVADSMHKIRVADLVISLNVSDNEELKEILYFIAKHRTGKSKVTIGPLPVEFECGRMSTPPLDEDWLEDL